jgi:hypothetical protein
MLIDALRIVARETGFTIINHSLGFTAIRENNGGYLLFCLSTGEWSIFDGRTARAVSNGKGLDAFLAAAHRRFDLPPDVAQAAERELAA